MASPGVFSGYLQAPRTALDYADQIGTAKMRAAQLQGMGLQQEAGRFELDRAQEAARQNALEQAAYARAVAAGGTQEDLWKRLEMSGSRGLAGEAAKGRKAALDAQKTRVDIKKDAATADKTALETQGMREAQAIAEIFALTTPQHARQSLMDSAAAGKLPPQQAQQMVAQLDEIERTGDPTKYREWQVRIAMARADANKRAELMNPKPGDSTTGDIKEFEYAQRRGEVPPGMTFTDWMRANKKAGAASVQVNTGQKGLDNERDLRNDFRQEPTYKAFTEMQSAYQQIKAGLASENPVGDMAAATKMMKLLDPGSVVRESELAMAMAASGRLDRLRNFVEMQINGTKLTPTQRVEFAKLADELMAASGQAYNAKRQEYVDLGGRYKLDTSVLGKPWVSGKPASKPQPAKPAGGQPEAAPREVDFSTLKD